MYMDIYIYIYSLYIRLITFFCFIQKFIATSILIQINGKNQHTKCLFDTHNFLLSTASLLSVAHIINTSLYPHIEPLV